MKKVNVFFVSIIFSAIISVHARAAEQDLPDSKKMSLTQIFSDVETLSNEINMITTVIVPALTNSTTEIVNEVAIIETTVNTTVNTIQTNITTTENAINTIESSSEAVIAALHSLQ